METTRSESGTFNSGPEKIGRRQVIQGLALTAGAPGAMWASRDGSAGAAGNRAHILVHPKLKERLTRLFTTVLGSPEPLVLNAPGAAQPILAFGLPGGGSLSVELSEEALDEQQARRGAWLELRTKDPESLKKKILE